MSPAVAPSFEVWFAAWWVGPEVGGTEFLAFDVINARMTVLEGGTSVSSDNIIKAVASTGMTAKPWDVEDASADQGKQCPATVEGSSAQCLTCSLCDGAKADVWVQAHGSGARYVAA